MNKLSFGGFVAIAAVYVAFKSSRGDELPPIYSWDFVALIAFGGFMFWLLRERRAGDDAGSHQGADKSFAFRLGKALKCIRGN